MRICLLDDDYRSPVQVGEDDDDSEDEEEWEEEGHASDYVRRRCRAVSPTPI